MPETDLQGRALPPLQQYVAGELDRIIGELPHYPTIAVSLAEQLKAVVAAWPNITYHGPDVSHG